MKYNPTVQPNRRGARRSRQDGSALLTAVIFSFAIMMLLGSYLYLSSSENRMASRSYLFGASFNLAEGGIDLGMDALRDDDSNGWNTGVDSNGDEYWARAYTDYDLGAGVKGEIKVVILKVETASPEIYSEGIAGGNFSSAMSKQLRVRLTSGFFPFLNGFDSKQGILLKGNNVTLDSYNSDLGSYGPGNRGSEVTVSTVSVESDAIDIGNADVYGYVATGGAAPDVGPRGSVTTYANPGKVDASRITTDYYTEFPDVVAPVLHSPSTTLPTSGMLFGGEYQIEDWSTSGNSALWIIGDVTIVATGDLNVSGQAGIYLANGATLRIFVDGDVNIGGNGVLNASQKPKQFLMFGTNQAPGGQTIKIAGNGYLAGAVYAPNAHIAVKGGGSSGRVYGAMAGYSSKVVGNGHFSYDEALADYNLIGTGAYSVDEWVELTSVSLSGQKIKMSEYGL